MVIRDPRPLARALVTVVALAAVAQVLRIVLRAWRYRDEAAFRDLILSPHTQPGDSAGTMSVGWVVAEGLLVVLVLVPLQLLAVVLWVLWQRRLRQNAAALLGADARRTGRRLGAVLVAAGVVVAARVLLTVVDGATRDTRPFDGSLVAAALAVDVLALALLVVVAWTTARWTREQDRLVRSGPPAPLA